MRVQFKVEGALPPKKDGANSMWKKDTEVPRLVALRRAALAAMAGRPPLSRNVRVGLNVHVGSASGRTAGDLDNYVTGVCDGLMAAAGGTPWQAHAVWCDPANAAFQPNLCVAVLDDSEVVEIVARKTSGAGAPWYEITLSDD